MQNHQIVHIYMHIPSSKNSAVVQKAGKSRTFLADLSLLYIRTTTREGVVMFRGYSHFNYEQTVILPL